MAATGLWRTGLGILAAALAFAGPASGQASADPTALVDRYRALHRETGNPAVLWLLAEALAAADRRDEALEALRAVADLRMGFYPENRSAILRLLGDAEADALLRRMAAEMSHVRRAREAHTVSLPGLVPEGIAWDGVSRRLFLGDMNGRRILAIGADGRPRRFVGDMTLRPLGMKVDGARGLLWVATSNAFWEADPRRSALVAYDLRTGALVTTIASADVASMNDLAIAPNGDLFVTDSLGGAVLRLAAGSDRLERITPAGAMAYPNGIAVADDGSLFVAQGASLRRIDPDARTVHPVEHPSDLFTLGIDGLYWHRGGLVAVQAGATPGRVLRLDLSPDRSRITGFAVIEAGNPQFDAPTTAAVGTDRMFVIANSQLDRLGADGVVADPETLRPIVILELALPQGA